MHLPALNRYYLESIHVYRPFRCQRMDSSFGSGGRLIWPSSTRQHSQFLRCFFFFTFACGIYHLHTKYAAKKGLRLRGDCRRRVQKRLGQSAQTTCARAAILYLVVESIGKFWMEQVPAMDMVSPSTFRLRTSGYIRKFRGSQLNGGGHTRSGGIRHLWVVFQVFWGKGAESIVVSASKDICQACSASTTRLHIIIL